MPLNLPGFCGGHLLKCLATVVNIVLNVKIMRLESCQSFIFSLTHILDSTGSTGNRIDNIG